MIQVLILLSQILPNYPATDATIYHHRNGLPPRPLPHPPHLIHTHTEAPPSDSVMDIS